MGRLAMSRAARPFGIASLAVLALGVVARGVTDDRPTVPTFGVDLGVVNLSLAVTDPHDHHVNDLTQGDFTVFEDGVRQDVCVFTRERLPISLTLLLDGSSSMKTSLPVAQAAAVRFIHTLRPEDDAQIAQFTRRYTVLQEPTSNHAALEAAVARVEAMGDTSLYGALYIAIQDLRKRPVKDVWRRRAVVVLTDGEDTSSIVSEEQLMDLARRAEVAVYAIGLFGPRPPAAPPAPTYFLTAVARETGGRAFFPKGLGELEGVYAQIAEELRTLYGLGYVPRNAKSDGGWRRIAIETVRPNLIVRHRLGYQAARLPGRPSLAVNP